MEVDELVTLTYIYTIMVAFQGLFIFLIFVVLSKQVREAYAKCWREKVNKSDFLSRYFGVLSTLKSTSRSSASKANQAVSKQGYGSSGHDTKGHSGDGVLVLKNSHVNDSSV